jgi:glycosyltransferase involved in cell wall biosynthesis
MTFASNSTPRFTFGIPVYNGEHTLKETLDCCAKLPANEVRVLVSDNASTDATYAIARAYADRHQHIIVYRHERNVGAANNFKYLLDSCRTEYFMWLAADDVIAPSLSLADVERLFQQYPRSMAVSPFAMVGEVNAQVPDRGNGSLMNNRAENTLRFLLRPGVNSRFYSIYRTERLRNLFAGLFGVGNGGYFASDIAFSVAVLREGEWPMEPSFVLARKPGISADGWQLRKSFSSSWLGAAFPSVRFIREIVGMVQPVHKIPVLIVASVLYVRYLIGPIRHRLAKLRKPGKSLK